jgi:hypothetical protein
MLAQKAQRFAAIDRPSNGPHRVSLVYNAASKPNPNPVPSSSRSPSSPLPSPSLDLPPLLPPTDPPQLRAAPNSALPGE